MSDRVYRLLLIDSDRIFRIGMLSYLTQFADFQVVADIDTWEAVTAFLEGAFAVDLVILDLSINLSIDLNVDLNVDLSVDLNVNLNVGNSLINGISPTSHLAGIDICQQIKVNYPQLPIFLLSAPVPPQLVSSALQLGVEGYCLKGTDAETLITAIRQVAKGDRYLGDRYGDAAQAIAPSPQPQSLPNSAIPIDQPNPIITIIKRKFYESGLQQIDKSLAVVQSHLANINANINPPEQTDQSGISQYFNQYLNQYFNQQNLQQIILAGQARELRAAKWLMAKIWQEPNVQQSDRPNASSNLQTTTANIQQNVQAGIQEISQKNINALAVQASLWDRTVTRLQTNLTNFTKVPLEIDILKDEKKRELLYIILRQIEQLITELRLSQVPSSQIEAKAMEMLSDIWRSVVVDFFGKYFVVSLDREQGKNLVPNLQKYQQMPQSIPQFASQSINVAVNVVDVVLKDEAIAKSEFLNKIPLFPNLISHLLFATALDVDNILAPMGSPEAMRRSELILDHLLVQIANAVIQPLLNHFADVEKIKQQFYRYNLLGTREVERFRNDLSWKYRVSRYVTDPQLIFESRYLLFSLSDVGIKQVSIYAPRSLELRTLEGVQLAVTLALELQDAIAPRLKSAITLLGNGFVYILTNVIGRGIGLIGRGVVQGIGNAWQDHRKK